MNTKHARFQPFCEPLEGRVALSHALGGAAAIDIRSYNADLNGDGAVDLADLQIMAKAYISRVGMSNYNPAADLNHDGKVDQTDAKLLERQLPKPPRGTPLTLSVHLVRSDQVLHPEVYSSGGVMRRVPIVTIIGHTIPGALVIADDSRGIYKFQGPLLPTNAQGIFTYILPITVKFNGTISFLVIDQFGRHLIRNFPVFKV